MSEHLVLARWQELAPEVKRLAQAYDLELLAMEQPRRDADIMERAMQAAVACGIPIVNCGPGGTSNDEESLTQTIDELGALSLMAEKYGVTLCVKAHVGASIFDTPTTLRAMEAISSPNFGIDMDPSHIHRADENPVEAIAAVISRVKHVHIRDCKGRQQGPGKPELQANGRGDIDLVGIHRCPARERLRRPSESGGDWGQGVRSGALLHHRRRESRPYAGLFAGVRRALTCRGTFT